MNRTGRTASPLLGMIYASLFGAMTAVGAFIMIPLPLVPITLQNFFLALAAALLGGALGALSQIVYVALGLIGLPVFAGGKAGLGVLLGPTGGYLVGFIAGAYLIGILTGLKERPGVVWLVISMVLGHLVIYGLGTAQLAFVAKLPLSRALAVGVLPFVPGDVVKILAASLIALKVRDYIRR
jgi:biotin transport system substrate-specific component